MRLSKRRRSTMADMNMTPMIDIVFLLLIFFMTVTQVSEINSEPVSLPVQEGSDDQQPGAITINVTIDGDVIVGGDTLDSGRLVALVSRELARVGDDPSRLKVVIRADQRSESGAVNQVVKTLGQMAITRIRVAVEVPQ